MRGDPERSVGPALPMPLVERPEPTLPVQRASSTQRAHSRVKAWIRWWRPRRLPGAPEWWVGQPKQVGTGLGLPTQLVGRLSMMVVLPTTMTVPLL
ncbi:hypothetical protein FB564_2735 [Salinispora arenicola]|uniref:Uncharacterized protein n=1 Tax=Salinispora arenicola TaxID=168697 RepID=A0A542XP42_SALAC|nr:hypothetical protein FB564_2735 [Salinispora arenicola]